MAKMTLKVPKGAVSMQEGTITEWMFETGAEVAVGDVIYAIETEKTTLEIECPFAGTLTRLAEVGETLPVGAPVAEIHT